MADKLNFEQIWDDAPSVEAQPTGPNFEQIWDSTPDPKINTLQDHRVNHMKELYSGAVEGVTGLAGLAADWNPLNALSPKSGYTDKDGISKYSEDIANLTDKVTFDPTHEGRYVRKLGQYIAPGAGIAKAIKAPMAATAFADTLASVGDQAATDLFPDNQWAPLIGSLTGSGLATGIGKGVGRYTAAGAERRAGKILSEAIGDEGVKNVLSKGDEVAEFGSKTLAEVADTPGAAKFQNALSKELGDAGGDALYNQNAARQGVRTEKLQTLGKEVGQEVTLGERGSRVKDTIGDLFQKEKEIVDGLWQLDDIQHLPFQAPGLMEEVGKTAAKATKIIDIKSNSHKVLKYAADKLSDGSGISLEDYADLRAATNSVIGDLKNVTSLEGRALMTLKKGLDKALEHAVETKQFPKDAHNRISTALKKSRHFHETFDEGVVKDFVKGVGKREENLIGRISTESGAKEFMRKFGDNAEMVSEMRGHLLDQAMKTDDPLSWVAAQSKKRGQFKTVFKDDLDEVMKVINDLGSQKKLIRLANDASKGQSFTAQGMAAKDFVNTKLNKGLQQVGRMLTGGVLGAGAVTGNFIASGALALGVGAISKLEKQLVNNSQRIIMQALSEPGFAKEILSKSNNVQTIAQRLLPYANRVIQSQDSESEFNPKSSYINQPNAAAATPANSISNIDSLYQNKDSNQRDIETIDKDAPKLEDLRGTEALRARRIQKQGLNYKTAKQNNMMLEPEVTKKPRSTKQLIASQPPAVRAMIHIESNGKVNAKSRVGASGLMQLMPATAKELGVTDINDPEQNIKAGTEYLKQMLTKYDDTRLAVAAYNWGPGNLDKLIGRKGTRNYLALARYMPKETSSHVAKFLAQLKKEQKA